MKFRYYSDLHGNLPDFKRDTDNQEICLIAGDVTEHGKKGNQLYLMLEELCFRFKHVVLVPGNHEHYGSSIIRLVPKIKELMDHVPNFTVLQGGQHKDFGNTRVIGATLWSDTSSIEYQAKTQMNDYRYIRAGTIHNPYGRRLTPATTTMLHHEHVDKIQKILDTTPGSMTTIVVTHHAPSYKSVARRFEGHPLNPAYVTELELDTWPDYWIHGHIHQAVEYLHNDCIVLCNPHGYSTEYTDFEPLKNYIEIN